MQKNFSWLGWLWNRSKGRLFVHEGTEELDICTATYPDFETLAFCNWCRGVFKLPNLGVEITVAFRFNTEK